MRVPCFRIHLIATSILSACHIAPPPPNPFVVPRQVFLDSVNTIVVTSATVVGDITPADSVLAAFETGIEENLREAGFLVVPAIAYATIWERIAEEAGGFYDPYTGERDEEKFQAAVARLRNELVEQFDPDALLYPEIWEVEVPFSDGVASWGGVREAIIGGRGYSGDVLAATLFTAIHDMAGNELYVRETGIQVIEYMLRGGRLFPLTGERLFGDSTLISAAVSRALQPIIETRTADTSSHHLYLAIP